VRCRCVCRMIGIRKLALRFADHESKTVLVRVPLVKTRDRNSDECQGIEPLETR
jgi:hypothetical protein